MFHACILCILFTTTPNSWGKKSSGLAKYLPKRFISEDPRKESVSVIFQMEKNIQFLTVV